MVGQLQRSGGVGLLAEEEHVDLTVVVEAQSECQDPLGQLLDLAGAVQPVHRSGDVEAERYPRTVLAEAALLQ